MAEDSGFSSSECAQAGRLQSLALNPLHWQHLGGPLQLISVHYIQPKPTNKSSTVARKIWEEKDEASSWSSRVLLSPSMRNSSQETLSMFAAQTQRLKEIDLRDGAGRVGSSTRKKQVEDLVSALVKMRIWGRRQTWEQVGLEDKEIVVWLTALGAQNSLTW